MASYGDLVGGGAGAIPAAGTTGYVAYYTAAGTIGGVAGFTFDGTGTLTTTVAVTTATLNVNMVGAGVATAATFDNEAASPANGDGSAIVFKGKTSTTANVAYAQIQAKWTNVTHASRTSQIDFLTANVAAPAIVATLTAGGRFQASAGSSALPTFACITDTGSGLAILAAGTNLIQLVCGQNPTMQLGFGTIATSLGARTIVSGSGAVLDSITEVSGSVTLSGSTNITTATGFNFHTIAAPAFTNASLAVSFSSTLYIGGAPTISGGGSITSPYSLWVDSGNVRLDGNLIVGAAVTGATAANGVLALGNGATAPTTSVDLVQFYAVDISAGNATLGIFTETAVATETVVSDRTLAIYVNGTAYKICLKV